MNELASAIHSSPAAGVSAHPLAFAELALEREHRLPEDHPRWPTDAISLGSRARALLAKLRPLAIRIMTFWDHHVRACTIGGRRLGIDATGSYRLE